VDEEALRAEVAWLIWCLAEGYIKPEDREILTNWLLEDPATLHVNDVVAKPHLLAMADQVIDLVRKGVDHSPEAMTVTREGPHSRACGIRRHDHGVDCHSNCPTCGGRRPEQTDAEFLRTMSASLSSSNPARNRLYQIALRLGHLEKLQADVKSDPPLLEKQPERL